MSESDALRQAASEAAIIEAVDQAATKVTEATIAAFDATNREVRDNIADGLETAQEAQNDQEATTAATDADRSLQASIDRLGDKLDLLLAAVQALAPPTPQVLLTDAVIDAATDAAKDTVTDTDNVAVTDLPEVFVPPAPTTRNRWI